MPTVHIYMYIYNHWNDAKNPICPNFNERQLGNGIAPKSNKSP